jgi:hypothetical protein
MLQNAPHLKTLIVQSGGLPARVVRQIARADLPVLEHLEVHLGSQWYGGDTTIEDIIPILSSEKFPKLKYLGLRNSEFTDQIAKAIAQSTILERLEVLDLSWGTIADEGAQALLDCPHTRKLKKLDLHRHYCSLEMMSKLKELLIEVDVSDPQQPDDDERESEEDRYCAVSE